VCSKSTRFDFIVSNIVLKHVPPEIACSYIREFLRVLAPEGIAVFQLPSHHRRPETRPLEAIAKQDAGGSVLRVDRRCRYAACR
jgi:SAM-dependent methyltransferase